MWEVWGVWGRSDFLTGEDVLERARFLIILAAALAIASCETAEKHRSAVKPPIAAMAPMAASHPPPVLASNPQKTNPLPATTARKEAISQLIDQAEEAYTLGMDDYQSGHLQNSKREFDKSLSILLSSQYDIRSNNRLSEEFNQLVDHINEAELAAIEHGNSLSAHQYVPTPIESFSGLTFPVNPNVAMRVQQEMRSVHLDIPLISNDTVSGVIAYLQKHARGYMDRVLTGSVEYGPMITAVLKKDGLPHDLLYLPGPESAFDPHATSVKGAKGIWQLMRSTAELLGLKENRWVDEREDPYRSTQAAAANLSDLFKEFGDWYLALAAYDSGPLTVQRAIERTGYADYWKLRELHALPTETQNYVPVFLATALIAKDPQAYGFNPVTAAPFDVDRVHVSDPTDLRLVAGIIGRPVDQLVVLNPALRGYETPANDPGYKLNLPKGAKDLFEKEIASVPPAGRLWWRATQVENGQTLASVAREYHVTTAAVALANHIIGNDPPPPGTPLLIPLARPRVTREATVRWVRRPYHYIVRPGDNIDLIADRFDVSPYQIRRWNRLRTSRIVRGRRLLVYRLVAVHTIVRRRYPVRRKRRVVRHAVYHPKYKRAATRLKSQARTSAAHDPKRTISLNYKKTKPVRHP